MNCNNKEQSFSDQLLEEATQKSRELVNLYKGHYQSIAFYKFKDLELNMPVQLADGVLITLLDRTIDTIDMVVKYTKGATLNFHNHPRCTETFIHLKGAIAVIEKKFNNNITSKKYKVIPGEVFMFDEDVYHKFIINSDSLDYIQLNRKK